MKILKIFILLFVFCGVSNADCNADYSDLSKMVRAMGWTVTSEMGGGHNAHSKHYRGKAVDVSVRKRTQFHIDILTEVMAKWGYRVLDERVRPRGQRVWGGPHLHIDIPYCK
jgi:hypothetical protein